MADEITYTEDVQKYLISLMLSNPDNFLMSQSIIKVEYFESKLKPAIRFILDYSNEFRGLPSSQQIKAITGITIEPEELTPQRSNWYLAEIEKFCRSRAVELVILDGLDLLNAGNFGEIEYRMKEAMTISLIRNLGTSFFDDPKERLERMRDNPNYVKTGWDTLDFKLYGGFIRGTLNIFGGGSGSGKSFFLQNLGLNWASLGMNVIYYTLELSEDDVIKRLYAMTTGFTTKEIFTRLNEVVIAVRQVEKNTGSLVIKKMPEAGTTSNHLRAHLKEYEIETGKKPDAIIVDYLDLMTPNNSKIDLGNLFIKDKFVSEEMRALAFDWDVPLASASQLNRNSIDASEYDHSHIAGGISKINTADNLFFIRTNPTMQQKGEYELDFMKTRASASTGKKIKLRFHPESMRITDMPAEPVPSKTTPQQTRDILKEASKTSIAAEEKAPPTLTTLAIPEGGSITRSIMSNMRELTEKHRQSS